MNKHVSIHPGYLTSHPPDEISKRSQRVVDRINNMVIFLQTHLPDCVLQMRWSWGSVPHVVILSKTDAYSVAWFGRHNTWRLFTSYGQKKVGEKLNFKTCEEVLDTIRELEAS